MLLTCGEFTPEGEFLKVPELDLDRLQAAWQEAVFALYPAEDKIEPAVVENMRSWPHSGFTVDQSVFLPAGDRAGIERLVQYMTRCSLSLSRLVRVTETGQVSYKAEKDVCRAFPDPQDDGLASGPARNFQILAPLDFLAEFSQHIPPKGAHLIRYYGWYSNIYPDQLWRFAKLRLSPPQPAQNMSQLRASRASGGSLVRSRRLT